jgi:hypothetical protein
MPPPPIDQQAVFLNIPYDEEFRDLYLAYIVGLSHLGLKPHIASEVPGGARRLERIFALIKSCRFSIHDLSRVELTAGPKATPRFNMPLELGLAIAWTELNPGLHTWLVFEAEPHRIQRSASDLNGTDACIHNGTPKGALSELRSAFWRDGLLGVPDMLFAYNFVQSHIDSFFEKNGTRNLYAPSVFGEICNLSGLMAKRLRHLPEL